MKFIGQLRVALPPHLGIVVLLLLTLSYAFLLPCPSPKSGLSRKLGFQNRKRHLYSKEAAEDDITFNEVWLQKQLPSIDRRYRREDEQRIVQQKEEEQKLQKIVKESIAAEARNERSVSSGPQQTAGQRQVAQSASSSSNVRSSSRTSSKQATQREVNASAPRNKFPLPFLDVESIGISGRWQESNGNFILEPLDSQMTPIGVVHFLGGAFVGAAPHLTYRYLLESLAEEGYLVVATPYRLDFDYVDICDKILDKFEPVGVDLAERYGPLPVIGIGHSCGALLQTLITSLFPQTPRAVNVLISFNNKPAKDAIPAFEELIVPISQRIMDEQDGASKALRERLVSLRNFFESFLDDYVKSDVSPVFVERELIPLYHQTAEVIDQLPFLLNRIAQGKRQFEPSPDETKEVCRRMYRARRTLVLRFENDDLDESPDIEKVLREANTIMRMKRPMIEMQVDFKTLTGSHITPLTPNVLLDASAISPVAVPDALNPSKADALVNFMQTIDDVIDEVLDFLDESVKGNS